MLGFSIVGIMDFEVKAHRTAPNKTRICRERTGMWFVNGKASKISSFGVR
jgi:hypothetical protein